MSDGSSSTCSSHGSSSSEYTNDDSLSLNDGSDIIDDGQEQKQEPDRVDSPSLLVNQNSILWGALYPAEELLDESTAPLPCNNHGSPTSGRNQDDSVKEESSLIRYSKTKTNHCGTESMPLNHTSSQPSTTVHTTTLLCQALEQRQWDIVKERLESHPHEATAWSQLPSLGNSPGLPLHLACSMRPPPPHWLVELLLQKYPDAVQVPLGSWGLLPLHLAVDLRRKHDNPASKTHSTSTASTTQICDQDPNDQRPKNNNDNQNKNDDLINQNDHVMLVHLLLQLYPQACHCQEQFHGMFPLHIAASTCPSALEEQKIDPVSYQVLLLLMQSTMTSPSSTPSIITLLELKDYNGDTPVDIARRIHNNNQSPNPPSENDSYSHAANSSYYHSCRESATVFSHNNISNNNATTNATLIIPSSPSDWKYHPLLVPPSINTIQPMIDATTPSAVKKPDSGTTTASGNIGISTHKTPKATNATSTKPPLQSSTTPPPQQRPPSNNNKKSSILVGNLDELLELSSASTYYQDGSSLDSSMISSRPYAISSAMDTDTDDQDIDDDDESENDSYDTGGAVPMKQPQHLVYADADASSCYEGDTNSQDDSTDTESDNDSASNGSGSYCKKQPSQHHREVVSSYRGWRNLQQEVEEAIRRHCRPRSPPAIAAAVGEDHKLRAIQEADLEDDEVYDDDDELPPLVPSWSSHKSIVDGDPTYSSSHGQEHHLQRHPDDDLSAHYHQRDPNDLHHPDDLCSQYHQRHPDDLSTQYHTADCFTADDYQSTIHTECNTLDFYSVMDHDDDYISRGDGHNNHDKQEEDDDDDDGSLFKFPMLESQFSGPLLVASESIELDFMAEDDPSAGRFEDDSFNGMMSGSDIDSIESAPDLPILCSSSEEMMLEEEINLLLDSLDVPEAPPSLQEDQGSCRDCGHADMPGQRDDEEIELLLASAQDILLEDDSSESNGSSSVLELSRRVPSDRDIDAAIKEVEDEYNDAVREMLSLGTALSEDTFCQDHQDKLSFRSGNNTSPIATTAQTAHIAIDNSGDDTLRSPMPAWTMSEDDDDDLSQEMEQLSDWESSLRHDLEAIGMTPEIVRGGLSLPAFQQNNQKDSLETNSQNSQKDSCDKLIEVPGSVMLKFRGTHWQRKVESLPTIQGAALTTEGRPLLPANTFPLAHNVGRAHVKTSPSWAESMVESPIPELVGSDDMGSMSPASNETGRAFSGDENQNWSELSPRSSTATSVDHGTRTMPVVERLSRFFNNKTFHDDYQAHMCTKNKLASASSTLSIVATEAKRTNSMAPTRLATSSPIAPTEATNAKSILIRSETKSDSEGTSIESLIKQFEGGFNKKGPTRKQRRRVSCENLPSFWWGLPSIGETAVLPARNEVFVSVGEGVSVPIGSDDLDMAKQCSKLPSFESEYENDSDVIDEAALCRNSTSELPSNELEDNDAVSARNAIFSRLRNEFLPPGDGVLDTALKGDNNNGGGERGTVSTDSFDTISTSFPITERPLLSGTSAKRGTCNDGTTASLGLIKRPLDKASASIKIGGPSSTSIGGLSRNDPGYFTNEKLTPTHGSYKQNLLFHVRQDQHANEEEQVEVMRVPVADSSTCLEVVLSPGSSFERPEDVTLVSSFCGSDLGVACEESSNIDDGPQDVTVAFAQGKALSELLNQLQQLRDENRHHHEEMERLKQRVTIMAGIRGVSMYELKQAMQELCQQEKQTQRNNVSAGEHEEIKICCEELQTSTEITISMKDTLTHWYQELCDGETWHAPADESPSEARNSACTTPDLSPPRIVKTNDGIDIWGPQLLPMPDVVDRSLTSLTENVLAGTDLDDDFSDWCDELMSENIQDEQLHPIEQQQRLLQESNILDWKADKEKENGDSDDGIQIRASECDSSVGSIDNTSRSVIHAATLSYSDDPVTCMGRRDFGSYSSQIHQHNAAIVKILEKKTQSGEGDLQIQVPRCENCSGKESLASPLSTNMTPPMTMDNSERARTEKLYVARLASKGTSRPLKDTPCQLPPQDASLSSKPYVTRKALAPNIMESIKTIEETVPTSSSPKLGVKPFVEILPVDASRASTLLAGQTSFSTSSYEQSLVTARNPCDGALRVKEDIEISYKTSREKAVAKSEYSVCLSPKSAAMEESQKIHIGDVSIEHSFSDNDGSIEILEATRGPSPAALNLHIATQYPSTISFEAESARKMSIASTAPLNSHILPDETFNQGSVPQSSRLNAKVNGLCGSTQTQGLAQIVESSLMAPTCKRAKQEEERTTQRNTEKYPPDQRKQLDSIKDRKNRSLHLIRVTNENGEKYASGPIIPALDRIENQGNAPANKSEESKPKQGVPFPVRELECPQAVAIDVQEDRVFRKSRIMESTGAHYHDQEPCASTDSIVGLEIDMCHSQDSISEIPLESPSRGYQRLLPNCTSFARRDMQRQVYGSRDSPEYLNHELERLPEHASPFKMDQNKAHEARRNVECDLNNDLSLNLDDTHNGRSQEPNTFKEVDILTREHILSSAMDDIIEDLLIEDGSLSASAVSSTGEQATGQTTARTLRQTSNSISPNSNVSCSDVPSDEALYARSTSPMPEEESMLPSCASNESPNLSLMSHSNEAAGETPYLTATAPLLEEQSSTLTCSNKSLRLSIFSHSNNAPLSPTKTSVSAAPVSMATGPAQEKVSAPQHIDLHSVPSPSRRCCSRNASKGTLEAIIDVAPVDVEKESCPNHHDDQNLVEIPICLDNVPPIVSLSSKSKAIPCPKPVMQVRANSETTDTVNDFAKPMTRLNVPATFEPLCPHDEGAFEEILHSANLSSRVVLNPSDETSNEGNSDDSQGSRSVKAIQVSFNHHNGMHSGSDSNASNLTPLRSLSVKPIHDSLIDIDGSRTAIPQLGETKSISVEAIGTTSSEYQSNQSSGREVKIATTENQDLGVSKSNSESLSSPSMFDSFDEAVEDTSNILGLSLFTHPSETNARSTAASARTNSMIAGPKSVFSSHISTCSTAKSIPLVEPKRGRDEEALSNSSHGTIPKRESNESTKSNKPVTVLKAKSNLAPTAKNKTRMAPRIDSNQASSRRPKNSGRRSRSRRSRRESSVSQRLFNFMSRMRHDFERTATDLSSCVSTVITCGTDSDLDCSSWYNNTDDTTVPSAKSVDEYEESSESSTALSKTGSTARHHRPAEKRYAYV